ASNNREPGSTPALPRLAWASRRRFASAEAPAIPRRKSAVHQQGEHHMYKKSPLAIAVLLIGASPAMADNFSQQTQAGTANKAVVEQLGGRSSANQDQNGERNRATVSQVGSVGSVSQTQVGSFNRLDADQYLAGRG